MCLGIPGRVVELGVGHADLASVDVEGLERPINVGLLREEGVALAPGDWVLIHSGFALEKIDEAQARAGLEGLATYTGLGLDAPDGESG